MDIDAAKLAEITVSARVWGFDVVLEEGERNPLCIVRRDAAGGYRVAWRTRSLHAVYAFLHGLKEGAAAQLTV